MVKKKQCDYCKNIGGVIATLNRCNKTKIKIVSTKCTCRKMVGYAQSD